MKKIALLLVLIVPAVYAADAKGGINKEKLQKFEQEIKAAEKKYHESVQATQNAKKNNQSQTDITRLEQEEQKAKEEWQAKKKEVAK
jgi:electron transfer flavoprotein alpha/beta subunit